MFIKILQPSLYEMSIPTFSGALGFISLDKWRAIDQHKNILFCFQRMDSNFCNFLVKNETLLLWKGEWEGGNVLIWILCCLFRVFSPTSSWSSHIYCLLLHLFTCQRKMLLSCWPIRYLFAWFTRLLQYALAHLGKIAFCLIFLKCLYNVFHSENFTVEIV